MGREKLLEAGEGPTARYTDEGNAATTARSKGANGGFVGEMI
jgi:hypothetical protein